jgi:hypothetical protein
MPGKYRRPARPNPEWLYKGFLIMSDAELYAVYDMTGRVIGHAPSIKGAQTLVDDLIAHKLQYRSGPNKIPRNPVKTPGGVKAYSTTRKRAKAQARLLRGIEHGMVPRKNPPVEIYGTVKEIIAQKGPGHECDSACKRAGHTYRHKFTQGGPILGNEDGSLTILPE